MPAPTDLNANLNTPSVLVAATKDSVSDSHTSQENPSSLFPMNATPWEIYLAIDDHPDCPMTSWIELHFSNPLQTDALQAALTEAVHRHPFLASRLIRSGDQWQWHYDPTFVPKLHDPIIDPMLVMKRTTDMTGTSLPSPRPLDLSKEPGCRFWLDNVAALDASRVGGSRLIIQLHHACCDGVGLRRVLIDALASYADKTGPIAGTADPCSRRSQRRAYQLDPARLLARGDFSKLNETPPKVRLSWWQKLKNSYYFHFQTPTSIVSHDEQRSNDAFLRDPKTEEPLRHHVFDEETSSRIQQRCRDEEVSLNDLALALLFRTCRRWNENLGTTEGTTRLRLLMPVDYRTRHDLKMPATNRLSFSFLGRTHDQCESWRDLLSSVQSETQWIKDTRVPMDFFNGITAIAKRPAAMESMIRRNGNMATSVLTYTGDIARGMKSSFPEEDGRRRIGDAFLENILIAPPARRNTNITLGLCINWGQICVSANWNRTALSAKDCEDFLYEYGAAWERWLASPDLS